nr:c-type cytochrome biogenesis protein CcmI [uncultured Rhodopila sp.]
MALLLGGLVFAALLPLVLPLLQRARPMPKRSDFDCAVYRDQLRELDRDVARGLISPANEAASRLEIQRRLLAAGCAPDAPEEQPRPGRSPVAALTVALFVAGGALGLYYYLGAAGTPDVVFVPRPPLAGATPGSAPVPRYADLQRAASRLAEKLEADPSNADRWVQLARTSASLRRWDSAADAYRHAVSLGLSGPDIQVGFGEMLVMQADGIVTPAAQDAFAATLKDDPKNEVARYYVARAAVQAGHPRDAIRQMQALLADIPEDSAMRDPIGRQIEQAAKAAGLPMPELARGTPSVPPGSVAKEANPDSATAEQQAARLAEAPDDAEGWMRLGRAYAALHERDKAADAYDRAIALVPGDAAIRLRAIENLLDGVKPGDTLPPRTRALLRQTEAIAPDQPELLWYLGLAAALEAHPADARRYWTHLLARLPAESENAAMVKAAMDSLKGG